MHNIVRGQNSCSLQKEGILFDYYNFIRLLWYTLNDINICEAYVIQLTTANLSVVRIDTLSGTSECITLTFSQNTVPQLFGQHLLISFA